MTDLIAIATTMETEAEKYETWIDKRLSKDADVLVAWRCRANANRTTAQRLRDIDALLVAAEARLALEIERAGELGGVIGAIEAKLDAAPALWELANRAAPTGLPVLGAASSADAVAAWLQFMDPNGCHTAERLRAEGIEPYTVANAWDGVKQILAELRDLAGYDTYLSGGAR